LPTGRHPTTAASTGLLVFAFCHIPARHRHTNGKTYVPLWSSQRSWRGLLDGGASLVSKVVDPLLSGHQLFVPSSQRRLTVTQFGAQQTPNAETSAGRFRACRRVLLLIYATTVVYLFYAPWNYLLLARSCFGLTAVVAPATNSGARLARFRGSAILPQDRGAFGNKRHFPSRPLGTFRLATSLVHGMKKATL
jgi:hypothetical protein